MKEPSQITFTFAHTKFDGYKYICNLQFNARASSVTESGEVVFLMKRKKRFFSLKILYASIGMVFPRNEQIIMVYG